MTILKQVKRCLETLSLLFDIYLRLFFGFFFYCGQGIARTQSPLRKNYALESPAFGVIADVSPSEVQWKSLNLGGLPCLITVPPVPGKYAWTGQNSVLYKQ